jgi:hypothetical protein
MTGAALLDRLSDGLTELIVGLVDECWLTELTDPPDGVPTRRRRRRRQRGGRQLRGSGKSTDGKRGTERQMQGQMHGTDRGA